MRKVVVMVAILSVAVLLSFSPSASYRMEGAQMKGPMVVHNVYFALKDNSPQAREKLLAACRKYLTKHPGTVFFAAGTLAEELNRPVNDREFDVALHVVFEDKKAHDQYQDAPRHKQFIDENKDSWKKVRVFDSLAPRE